MSNPVFYALVVIVWSTTPLAIHYSNDSLSAIAAVNVRMLIAFFIVAGISCIIGFNHFRFAQNWRLYLASSIGIFPNMPLVYASANYISSGLISVLFALSPFITAFLAQRFLLEKTLGKRQIVCLLIALVGLVIVTQEHIQISSDAWKGIVLMLLSCFCFSINSIAIKYYAAQLRQPVSPPQQLTGSLMFSLPGLLITWLVIDKHNILKLSFSETSLYATLYLALVGSVIGFMAYYFLLRSISAVAVSLIPLITPAFSLILGKYFNAEVLNNSIIMGTSIIIAALALFNDDIAKRIKKLIN